MCKNLPVNRRPFASVLLSSLAPEPRLALGGAACALPQSSSPHISAARCSIAESRHQGAERRVESDKRSENKGNTSLLHSPESTRDGEYYVAAGSVRVCPPRVGGTTMVPIQGKAHDKKDQLEQRAPWIPVIGRHSSKSSRAQRPTRSGEGQMRFMLLSVEAAARVTS